jgi:formyltetrahydrofolate deformylase
MKTGVLIFQCLDQKGIVAKLAEFIFKHNANIICADQYSTNPKEGYFFIRIEFCFNSKEATFAKLREDFIKIAAAFKARWKMVDKDEKIKMGILVSSPDHCLAELLYQWRSGDLNVDIPFVISNHDKHAELLRRYGIPYYIVAADSKDRKEKEILKLIEKSDFLVLARYMQILSSDFLKVYNKDIINIHHSFLPSFKGANPYLQAHEKGVKVIGATAHFVSANLDEGPIVEQLVARVTHKDSVEDLKNKGKNLEKIALANAIRLYLDYRVIKFKNKTIVF